MSILKFVRSLNPVGERKEVMHILTQMRDGLRDYTLPTARDTQEVFAGVPLQSRYAKAVDQVMRRRVRFQGSFLDVVVSSLEQLETNIPVLEREVKSRFSLQFSASGITYDRANLLRYIELASFYVRYANKLLLRMVAEEALARGSATPMQWSRAEREWIDNNLNDFAYLYASIALDSSKLRQAIAKTSNAEVQEDTHELAAQSLGTTQLDPMGMERVSHLRNPLFGLGKALAEREVKRYQANKEEHQALQLRLQELREILAGGNTSPKLQKLIQYTEHRIEELDYKITKVEEENRLD